MGVPWRLGIIITVLYGDKDKADMPVLEGGGGEGSGLSDSLCSENLGQLLGGGDI